MSTDNKILMLYRPGYVSKADIAKLEATGFTCVGVKSGKFSEVSFPTAQGIEFFSGDDQMSAMVLRAAVDSYDFDKRLGTLMVKAMKEKAGIVPPKK